MTKNICESESDLGFVEIRGLNPVVASEFFLDFFEIKLLRNCEDHFHCYSLSVVDIFNFLSLDKRLKHKLDVIPLLLSIPIDTQ